eukprot:m.84608 g.84608  ORF g.84608 m.84608 type:complete len:415 (+) comp14694_c0_seq1:226-1470(+)
MNRGKSTEKLPEDGAVHIGDMGNDNLSGSSDLSGRRPTVFGLFRRRRRLQRTATDAVSIASSHEDPTADLKGSRVNHSNPDQPKYSSAEPVHFDNNSPELEGRTAHLMQSPQSFSVKGLEPTWKLRYNHLLDTIGRVLLMAAAMHIAAIVIIACLLSLEPSGLTYTPDLGHFNVTVQAGFLSRLSFTAATLLSSAPPSHITIIPYAFWTHLLWHLCAYTGHTMRILMALRLFFALSKPAPSVIFSKWMVTTNKSLTGLHSLEFRLANKFGFDRKLLQAQISVTICLTPHRNPTKRRFKPLKLVSSTQPMMPTMWTISHVIDQESPLYGKTWDDLDRDMASFMILFNAVDPDSGKDIYELHQYSCSQLLTHATFEPVTNMSELPKVVLDFDKFHSVNQQRVEKTDPGRATSLKRS